jgi:dUTP pyrophosphatase
MTDNMSSFFNQVSNKLSQQGFQQFMLLKIFVSSDSADELKEKYVNAAQKHNDKLLSNLFIDSGFDLFVPEEKMCSPDDINKIDYGIICESSMIFNDQNKENRPQYYCGYYLYPRSSISDSPLRLANSVGIIDAGYRGNIKAKFDCIVESHLVKKYERLTQICAPGLNPVFVVIVDSLNELKMDTERGGGGFGSTGKT